MSTTINTPATPEKTPSAIEALAIKAGFEIEWQDAHKQIQRVPEATLTVLLERLGLPCDTAAHLKHSTTTLEAELSGRKLPPLMTAEIDRAIALPMAAVKTGARYRIELESGAVIDGRFTSPRGQTALLSPISEPGYHTLVINEQRTTLAVSPARCYTIDDAWRALEPGAGKAPPMWGVAAQVYGLRRVGDGGVGDFTALATLAAETAQRGSHAVAISPMHAMFSAQPQKFSPYSPSSRLFLNIAHIDVAAVLGAEAAQAAIETAGVADEFAELETLQLIDWPRVVKAKLAVLRALFAHFIAQPNDTLHKDFAKFVKRGGRALEDHARFEALQAAQLKESDEGYWRNWPDALRDPRSTAVSEFAAAHQDEVDFFLFAQWLAAKGLSHAQHVARDSGMAIGLIADLAVGCDSAGSHAWSYRDEMLQGVSVGAPPDLFNQAGQSWGLTTFSPRAMRTQGFSAFIDMLRAGFTLAGGIRIDHILGLRRLWLVPDGESAKNGAYLRYPLDDLLRLIALESWRHKAIVIGEDLGTVPPGFRERLKEHGLLGIRVLWFEQAEEGPGFKAPADWDHDVTATTTTHDLPTVTGWWVGEDIVWRSKIGQTAARSDGKDAVEVAQAERGEDRKLLWTAFQEAGVAAPDVDIPVDITPQTAPVDEALAFVASTPAPLVTYPLEDLLALAEMPNLPGSIDEHPNWRRRLAVPVTELFDDDSFVDRLLAVDQARQKSAQPKAATSPPKAATHNVSPTD